MVVSCARIRILLVYVRLTPQQASRQRRFLNQFFSASPHQQCNFNSGGFSLIEILEGRLTFRSRARIVSPWKTKPVNDVTFEQNRLVAKPDLPRRWQNEIPSHFWPAQNNRTAQNNVFLIAVSAYCKRVFRFESDFFRRSALRKLVIKFGFPQVIFAA